MNRVLIEVPHETEKVACARAIRSLLRSGSHFLTHADFGCRDGEHKAWVTVDAKDKEEALSIVPMPYRSQSRVVQLNKFTLEEIEDFLGNHEGQA